MDAALVLDMPTLVMARVVSIVVFAIGVPIMTLRKDRPETAVFCWSLLMAILSWITVIAAVFTRNLYVVALYAGCISATVSLQWAAIVIMTGRKVHSAWFVVPPVGVAVVIMALRVPSPEAAILSCIVLSLQLAAASAFVMVCGRQVVRPSTAVLMALGYAFSFCSAISRPLEVLFSGRVDLYALSGDASNTLPFFASYIGTTLIILSWLAALKDRAEARLALLAFRDELTGLANRRALHEQGRKLWSQSRWQGTVFTLVALDLDFFKKVNDRWGHEEGDRVLAAFGDTIMRSLPAPEIAARMGGEEFCLIYAGADARTVHDFVEQLRDDFAHRLQLPDGSAVRFSAGVAQSAPDDDGIRSVYRRADNALYQAKASGRDCAIIGSALAA
ncbi:GGDEF domain-containing protein [Devosia sp. XJ19-1]|uniref:diguanylate cyclase n=1 Tax=Devosia ureilytica TaxID=2952754 RepID=A0A9Q4AKS7_9HYPH|nr:GGDEF domain-containing protein [Devosia ureilytica]MCP8885644.1 GGDEF domain-containing protein [Devosia ureilytica]